MPDENKQKTPEKEATEALQGLLQRLGDVFGLFDLSFFVAGAVCLGALVFGAWLEMGTARFVGLWPAELKLLHVGVGAVGGYVLGIVCFAFGRLLSRRKDFYTHLELRLAAFGVKEDLHEKLAPGPSERYTVLWVELRQNKELSPSFNLLLRYWVMAAMCDGLSVAFGLWTLAWLSWMAKGLASYASWLGWVQPPTPPGFIQVIVLALLVGATLICGREGRRYADGQMTELLATLAHRRGVLKSI